MAFKFELGSEIKTRVTALKGIITSRAENLYGCNRYVVQPPATAKEQKVPESFWVDEEDVVLIKSEKIKRVESNRGGPMERVKATKRSMP